MIGTAHKLAELERSNGLVGGNETVEARGVHVPVDVRNQLQGNAIDARAGRRRAVRQPRQLPAVRRRQVPSGHPDLLLDQVEIIQQPFGRRRVPPFAFGRFRHELIRSDKNAFILI